MREGCHDGDDVNVGDQSLTSTPLRERGAGQPSAASKNVLDDRGPFAFSWLQSDPVADCRLGIRGVGTALWVPAFASEHGSGGSLLGGHIPLATVLTYDPGRDEPRRQVCHLFGEELAVAEGREAGHKDFIVALGAAVNATRVDPMQFMKDARQSEVLEQLCAQQRDLALMERADESDDRRRHLEAMAKLARSSSAALSRENYEPGHFTASAFVVSPCRRELLLIRHKKLGMWLQPGGHIEATDRDLVAAARREAQEETGLGDLTLMKPFFDVDVHEIPAWGESPAHLHHDVRSLFVSDVRHVAGADDAAEARWFAFERIAESRSTLVDGVGTDESVRRVARALSRRSPALSSAVSSALLSAVSPALDK